MRVRPKLDDWMSAYRVYRRFATRPGSEHIATWRALACLSALVRLRQPESVLEFGAGIGTITYLLLTTLPKLTVVGLETNPFCLTQLDLNIPDELKPRLMVVTDGKAPPVGAFDLIVIDGRLPGTDDWSFLRQGTLCFVEGNRQRQSAKLREIAASKNLVLDLEKQSFGGRHIAWKRTGLGIRRPVLGRRKTCRIGICSSTESIRLPTPRWRRPELHQAQMSASGA